MNKTAVIFVLVAMCSWAAQPVFERWALRGATSPLDSDWIRLFWRSLGVFLVVFPCVLIGSLCGLMPSPFPVAPGRAIALMIGGILGGFTAIWAFYRLLSLPKGEVSWVVPTVGAHPALAAALGLIILREQFSWGKLIGVAITVVGLMILAQYSR